MKRLMTMKKKKTRLLVQVTAVLIPVFVLMIASIMYLVYSSTINGFLEAQNSHMEETLKHVKSFTGFGIDQLDWYLDYMNDHFDEITQEITPEESAAFDEHMNEEDLWMLEWLQSTDKNSQSYCAKIFYQTITSSASLALEEGDYESVFMVSLDKPNDGRMIFQFKDADHPEERKTLDLDTHPVLNGMTDSAADEVRFERTNRFTEEGSYYIGYIPYSNGGKTRAVIGIVYNWADFDESMYSVLKKTVLLGLVSMVLMAAVLFAVLYQRTIKPVERIGQSVTGYIESKDSAAVTQQLSEIKAANEIGELSQNISEMVSEINSYMNENIKLAGERERVAAELDMAAQIQAGQLPSVFPAFPDRDEFDIYAAMTPAKEVGGDFYDFFLVDDDHLGMVIADVSGKGVPAALFMMMSKMLINNFAAMGLPPHEVLERTNAAICQNNKQNMFVTVWLGILEISTGRLTAANAGHEYPIIRQPGGEFELLKDKHGFVCGGMKGLRYKQYELTLQRGAQLFVYTDGVPEATDPQQELYGLERLLAALNRTPDASPEELLKNVHNDVNSFVGSAPQFDDLTMLGLRLK